MPASATDPAKDAALIVDGATGNVLYSRNADAERHPASLTKMMTLYLLFDALKKGQMSISQTPLPMSEHAAVQQPTKLHLRAGDYDPGRHSRSTPSSYAPPTTLRWRSPKRWAAPKRISPS